jgi:hypothetical protein
MGRGDRGQPEAACDATVEHIRPKPVRVNDVGRQSLQHATNGGTFSEVGARGHDDALHADIGLTETIGERIVRMIAANADDVNTMPGATLDDGESLDHAFQPSILTGLENVNDGQWRLANVQRRSVELVGVDKRNRV